MHALPNTYDLLRRLKARTQLGRGTVFPDEDCQQAATAIMGLEQALAAERARAEKAERERDESVKMREFSSRLVATWQGNCEAAKPRHAALLAETRNALEAMDGLSNFAWSAVAADCEEARIYLNSLVEANRVRAGSLRQAIEGRDDCD